MEIKIIQADNGFIIEVSSLEKSAPVALPPTATMANKKKTVVCSTSEQVLAEIGKFLSIQAFGKVNHRIG